VAAVGAARPGGARRRLAQVALVVHTLLVLRITQWPELADPSAMATLDRLMRWAHAHGLPDRVDVVVVEAVANVVMFMPFGLLLPVVLRRPAWVAVPIGAVFSVLLELGQLVFFPSRVPTAQDVLMNTLGAALGAALLLGARTVEPESRRA
jgi:VanZ family protein